MFMTTTQYSSEQQQAIDAREGRFIVNAGAGSGKTTVLIARLEALINDGISPDRVAFFSFTKAAAGEIQKRLSVKLGEDVAEQIDIKTLHSKFNGIVIKNMKRVLGNSYGGMISDSGARSVIEAIMKPYDGRFNPLGKGLLYSYSGVEIKSIKNYQGAIALLKEALVTPETYRNDPAYDGFIYELWVAYEAAKRQGYTYGTKQVKGRVIDFSDMLCLAYEMLSKDADLLHECQGHYDYIMVDEAQDNNMVQYKLVDMLAAKCGNLMIVGDDYQSIYGFRGAVPAEFIKFAETAIVIDLGLNYRSRNEIVEYADRIIRNNTQQLWKTVAANKTSQDTNYGHLIERRVAA